MTDFSKKYLTILEQNFSGLNLTAITDVQEFHYKQYLDSLAALQSDFFKSAVEKTGVVLDVGFGGGFPLLPLALELPEVFFLGIDSKAKKVKAVEEIAAQFELPNIMLAHHRLEDLLIDRPIVLVFKAVGKIMDLLPLINLESPSVWVFFYKGPSYFIEEKNQLKHIKNWSLLEEKELVLDVPKEIDMGKRYLVGFKANNSKGLFAVPRGTLGKKRQKLLKISQLF